MSTCALCSMYLHLQLQHLFIILNFHKFHWFQCPIESGTSTLPCDFFSARLFQLYSPCPSPCPSPRKLVLPVPSSRCSTGVPQSRGTSRGSAMESPWPSVQLDQVFTTKQIGRETGHGCHGHSWRTGFSVKSSMEW